MLVTIQIKHLQYGNTYRYCSNVASSESSQEVGLGGRGRTRRGFEVELKYPRDEARSLTAHLEIKKFRGPSVKVNFLCLKWILEENKNIDHVKPSIRRSAVKIWFLRAQEIGTIDWLQSFIFILSYKTWSVFESAPSGCLYFYITKRQQWFDAARKVRTAPA